MHYQVHAKAIIIRPLFADPVTYLSAGIDLEYLHSVTIIIKPMKCLISAENYVAIAQWYRKL